MPDSLPRNEEDGRLAEAVEEFLEARRRGAAVDPRAFAERHAAIRSELEVALDALDLLDRIAPEADEPPPPGASVFGEFRIRREIGRGGMGVVYEAEQIPLRRRVALKLLPEARLLDPGSLQRFRREAEAASRLDHPGICAVLAAGVENGIPWIAMRFVEGETLAQRLASAGAAGVPPTWPAGFPSGSGAGDAAATEPALRTAPDRPRTVTECDAWIRIVEDVARALHAAHEAGIVHRDVKPGNIMIGPDGRPVLLDFGLARIQEDDAPALTRTGDVFGTPAYMAPEQVAPRGSAVDRRADVWALGVILFECLGGRRPFAAPTREALARAILAEDPVPLRRLNPAVRKEMEVVAATALEKDLSRRYRTAADLAEDLRRLRMREPVLARPVPWLARPFRWARRRPLAAAFAAAVAVALLAIGGLGGWLLTELPRARRGAAAERAETLDRLLDDGFYEVAEGSARRALGVFDAVRELEPDSVEAAAGRVLAHRKLGDAAAARRILDARAERGGAADPLRFLGPEPAAGAAPAEGAGAGADPGRSSDHAPAGPPATGGAEPSSALECFLGASALLSRCGTLDDGERRRALELAHRAVLLAGTPRTVHVMGFVHAAVHAPDLGMAAAALRTLEAHVTPTARTGMWRGLLLSALGDHATAEPLLVAHLERTPDDPTVLGNLAIIRRARQDHASSLALLRRAAALPGASAGIWFNLGIELREAGFEEEASDAAEAAVRLEPRTAKYRWFLANRLRKRGRLDDAVRELREGVRLAPRDRDLRDELGAALERTGDRAGAIESYREALRIDARHVPVLVNLGVLLRKAPEGAGDARRLFEEAVRLEPGNAAAHWNLGDVLRQLGRFREALHHAGRGAALAAGDPAWPFDAESHLPRFRALAEGEESLERYLAGAFEPPDLEAWMSLLVVEQAKGLHRMVVETVRDALARPDPTPASRALLKARGLASAFAAGLGSGADSAVLLPAEREVLGRQARDWLADLSAAGAGSGALGPSSRARVHAELRAVLADAAFAPVRDEEPFARRSDADRAAGASFWSALRDLIDSFE